MLRLLLVMERRPLSIQDGEIMDRIQIQPEGGRNASAVQTVDMFSDSIMCETSPKEGHPHPEKDMTIDDDHHGSQCNKNNHNNTETTTASA